MPSFHHKHLPENNEQESHVVPVCREIFLTKKKPARKKKKMGGQSVYEPDFHPVKAGELALMGLTDAQMAAVFGIGETTLNRWKKRYPEFLASLKGGKEQADAPVVKSLYQRALGYTLIEKKMILNPDGSTRKEVTEKEIAPDVIACMFWLKNRQSKDWRDKHDVSHTGDIVLHFDREDEGR